MSVEGRLFRFAVASLSLSGSAGLGGGATAPTDGSGDTPAPARSVTAGPMVDAPAVGPDLIIADLWEPWRVPTVGEIAAFGIGIRTCNIGSERVNWYAHTEQHPLILLNLYRLKDDRFEQIGMSWMANAVYATSEGYCTPCADPTNGTQLGVGCSDTDHAMMNAIPQIMIPRSTVNAQTGDFAFPWVGDPPTSRIDRCLLVHAADLDPGLNADAVYFAEVQHIAADDAAARNDDNNASYRRVNVVEQSLGVYDLVFDPAWPTQAGQPAVRAWQDHDPDVWETEIRVPNEGLFILAAKASELDNGFWRYEYALQNVNSHRSAASFSICFEGAAENVGFSDVDYHSGEIYDSTDWTATVTEGGVHWSTQSCAVNPNANALRFGTIYNFRFDATSPPWWGWARARIGLFRPGVPQKLWEDILGPPACLNLIDVDHDGEGGCFDFCPGTPAGTCTCQGIGLCCLGCSGPCLLDFPRDECVDEGGTPDGCGDPRCKNGCPLLDMDNDGDRDLADVAGFQRCFSGSPEEPGHVAPTRECVNRLDINDDHAIDLGDYKQLFELGLLDE